MNSRKLSFFIKESVSFISYLLVGIFSCVLAFFLVIQFLNPALSKTQNREPILLAKDESQDAKGILKNVLNSFKNVMRNNFGDSSNKLKETQNRPLPENASVPSGDLPPSEIPENTSVPSGNLPPPEIPENTSVPSGDLPPPEVPENTSVPSGDLPPPEVPANTSVPSGDLPPPEVPENASVPSGNLPPPEIPENASVPSGNLPPPEIPANTSVPSGNLPPSGVPENTSVPSGNLPPPGVLENASVPSGNISLTEAQSPVLEVETFMSPFIYDPERRRDPFEDPTILKDIENIVFVPKTPPEEYDLSQLQLKGIIWDINSPKALFQLPGQGGFYTLLRGDKVGKNGTIFEIREDEVVIVESIVKVSGSEKVKETDVKIIKLDRLKL